MKKTPQKLSKNILRQNKGIIKDTNKQTSGITLIALVITIIVLLILAGVAISMLSGDNGILNRATQAREQTGIKGIVEQINLAIAASMLNSNAEIDPATLESELKSYFGNDNVTGNSTDGWVVTAGDKKYNVSPAGKVIPTAEIADLVNDTNCLGETTLVKDASTPKQTFYIPAGFRIAQNDGKTKPTSTKVSEGIVIEDANRNQFVWIPVENAIYDSSRKKELPTEFTTGSLIPGHNYTPMAMKNNSGNYVGLLYDYNSTNGAYLKYGAIMYSTTDYREPALLRPSYDGSSSSYGDIAKNMTASGMQKAYDDMIKSVATYGGFYVGRYEMSVSENSTAASVYGAISATNASSSCKPYTNTTYWWGLYGMASTYSNSASSVTSSMIWGSQYDAMLNWMVNGSNGYIDVTSKTPYQSATSTAKASYNDYGSNNSNYRKTGTKAEDVINNIYDLLGNSYEWTLEAYSTLSRALRGSSYRYSNSPKYRSDNSPNSSDGVNGTRLSLYIK